MFGVEIKTNRILKGIRIYHRETIQCYSARTLLSTAGLPYGGTVNIFQKVDSK